VVQTTKKDEKDEFILRGYEIPPYGRYIITMNEYYDLVFQNDIDANSIRILIPDMSIFDVTVRDFGCVGDGIVNDTYNFQRAIDFVGYHGGGTVNIPPGIYLVEGLIVKRRVLLKGASPSVCVLRAIDKTRSCVSFTNEAIGLDSLKIAGVEKVSK